MSKKVLLITKLKTTNIGNQALSDELVKLYEHSNQMFQVTGRPEGLFGYSIEKLKKSSDPVVLFEKWANGLVNRLGTLKGQSNFKPGIRFVELLSFEDFKVKNDGLFQAIKNIFRRFVHTEVFFARTYRKRFLSVSSADKLVYSGAGEVGDNNIFLRQLLELRIAQLLGKKTYAINQSVEVVEQPMQSICANVYKHMEKILVRGTISKRNMVTLGIPVEKIICCPDSAFLNPQPSQELVKQMAQKFSIKNSSVGINATKVAGDLSKWAPIIETIKELGYTVYFISNDPFGDRNIGEQFSKRFGISAILDFIPYPGYSALLANFKFVISCRLHTNELSLTGGTPIIPIEGSHFKTREVFSLINYPIPVLDPTSADWHIKLIEQIKAIHVDSNEVHNFVKHLNDVRKLSEQNLII